MIGKLEYYINRAIPYAWDDSESWYEFLAKVISKVNELVDMSNDYFDKDLAEYVEQILNAWHDSGRLDDIVLSAVGIAQNKLDALDAQVAEKVNKGDIVIHTKDYPSIQEAINNVPEGGTVVIQNVEHTLTEAITIPKSNIKIVGYGAKLTSSLPINFFIISPSASYVTIEGLHMGKTEPLSGPLLSLEKGSHHIHIKKCYMENSVGFVYSFADNVIVEKNVMTNGGDGDTFGVSVFGDESKILHNEISKVRVGVFASSDETAGSNHLIDGNKIYNCGSTVKEVDGAITGYVTKNLTIVNNEIDLSMVENVQVNGIRLRNVQNGIVSNNHVKGGWHCISISPYDDKASNINVVGNICESPTHAGIATQGRSHYINVVNNIFKNTPSAGIYVANDAPKGITETISVSEGSKLATLSETTTKIQEGCVLVLIGHTNPLIVDSVNGVNVTFTQNAETTLTNTTIQSVTAVPKNVHILNNLIENYPLNTGIGCIQITGLMDGRIMGNLAKQGKPYETCLFLMSSYVKNVMVQNNTLKADLTGYAIREYNVPAGSGNKFVDNHVLAGTVSVNDDSFKRELV